MCLCIVLTLSLSLLCLERKAQMIIASNVSINVFEAASGNSKLNSLRTSLPVVARSIDIDYTEQTLYWISETDGVSNGVGVAGWAGQRKYL